MNKQLFITEITVQVGDLNYGNHLANDRFLNLAQEARVRWLNSLGLKENCLILTEAHIKYLNEAFWNDTIVFELSSKKCSKCSMVIDDNMTNKSTQKAIGEISTTIAFFDYEKRKIVKTPQVILDQFKGLQDNE